MFKFINNLEDAIESLTDILEVDSVVVYNGSEVIFSNLEGEQNIQKIIKAIFNAKNNIGFELGANEIDVIGSSNTIKFFMNRTQIILIFLKSDSLISDTVLNEKADGVFNFMKN